jgi:hypothetical protein
VLSATDILTAYLPVAGEHRGIAPWTVGLLLSLRAAATIACRLVFTPPLRLLGRTLLLSVSCLLAAVLCAGLALPVGGPVPVLLEPKEGDLTARTALSPRFLGRHDTESAEE